MIDLTEPFAKCEMGSRGPSGLLSCMMACLILIVMAPAASAGLAETQQSDFTRVILIFDRLGALDTSALILKPAAKTAPIVSAKPFSLAFTGPLANSQFLAVDCLTAAVYYEAANEPVVGQRAVAQVVLNRLKHPSYPDTICGVVFQGAERNTGCQFTFTCDGSLGRSPSMRGWLRARAVAAAALSGFVEPSVGLATHYHAVYVTPDWADSLVKLNTIASHIFYQWPGKTGTSSSFMQHYNGVETMPSNAASALSSYMLSTPFDAIVVRVPGRIGDVSDRPLNAEDFGGVVAIRARRKPVTVETPSARSDEAIGTQRLALPDTHLKDDLSGGAIIADQPTLLD